MTPGNYTYRGESIFYKDLYELVKNGQAEGKVTYKDDFRSCSYTYIKESPPKYSSFHGIYFETFLNKGKWKLHNFSIFWHHKLVFMIARIRMNNIDQDFNLLPEHLDDTRLVIKIGQ